MLHSIQNRYQESSYEISCFYENLEEFPRRLSPNCDKMLQPEQVLQNRYQLKQKLGKNPIHQTWLAIDKAAKDAKSSHVVVKLLACGGDVRWDDLKLFEREAQVLRQLNHPRIPQYRDYFSIDDQLLWFGLVEEFIPGKSLKEELTQGKRFTEPKVRQIAEDVLEILVYLHELNPPVLHRDIKPSNLILGKDERVYLVDFGAVQDRAAAEGATFTVVGTYGYAPLEQFGGRAVPASDLYGLGATLIHLLIGTAPANLPTRNSRLQFAEFVKLNPGFARWLEQLTEPDREQRFTHARQALEALRENNAAICALQSFQPNNSRILFYKSPQRLVIKIPQRQANASDGLKLIELIVWFCLCGYIMLNPYRFWTGLCWLFFGLLAMSWWLLPTFRQTYLHFDTKYFEIKWKIFGLVGRQHRGRISEIDKVGRGEVRGASKVFPGVSLTVGVKEYIFSAFAPALTEAECQWLIQEIKTWLGRQ